MKLLPIIFGQFHHALKSPGGCLQNLVTMSDEEWVPSAEEEEGDTSPPKSRPKRSLVRPANYANEKQDDFFVGVKGYTNFHRTRKGGDRRPCSAQRPVFLLPVLLSIQRMHTCLAFHTHACRRS